MKVITLDDLNAFLDKRAFWLGKEQEDAREFFDDLRDLAIDVPDIPDKVVYTNEIDQLDNAIGEKVGDYYWLETEDDSDNPIIVVQVYEYFKDDVEKILKDFGYEILECSWFSGSDYDGYTFTVKKGE